MPFLNYLPLHILFFGKTKQNKTTILFGWAILESLLLATKNNPEPHSKSYSQPLEDCSHKAEDGKLTKSANDNQVHTVCKILGGQLYIK